MTPTEFNPAEFQPMGPALEQAVSEIRAEAPDPAVIEAAAARVWARLAEAAQPKAPQLKADDHIRGCADFQSLIPDYRAGRLPAARATLLQDHLHECVACRRVYEGKVVPLVVPQAARRTSHQVRWAIAAVVVAAAGLSVWVAVDQYGTRTGHAIVQTVNGALYEVSADGIHPLAAGQPLPDGVELRTAADSDAVFQLRDGSLVELRERSGFSTTATASDLTVRLVRGSVIVQAAKRRSGHFYVATADFRVAVTGTIFSVSAGVKGSRVSVIQGEVHVSQDNQERVLHPGEQSVSSPSLEPMSVKDDISWSRDRDRLVKQLEALRADLQKIHLPALRYSSALLARLPASTVFFASIPNLSDYLAEAQTVFQQKMAESPQLRAWWASRGTPMEIDKLRAAGEYLGGEIVLAVAGPAEGSNGPVFVAEVKRDGFPEFLKKADPRFTVETRPGLVVFGPVPGAVKAMAQALDAPTGFDQTPFYARISSAYRDGAGMLLCADLAHLSHQPAAPGSAGAQYFFAEEKEVDSQLRAGASLEFNGPRTGIAGMLADPAPMGSLDYVSPDATLVAAFAVKNPAAIVDMVTNTVGSLPFVPAKTRADLQQQTGAEVRNDMTTGLGGDFSISLDGPLMPVPSWKLVAEVYDPGRIEAALRKFAAIHDQAAAKSGDKPLRTSTETVDGRTYYMIASGDVNALTEIHYTFDDGYMIAGPTRALVSHALQAKMAGTSITHSAQFVAMTPRDRYANFSALLYEKLGTTLSPLVSLFGAFAPQGAHGPALESLNNVKPMMFVAYGEPDRITISGAGDLTSGMSTLLGGNLLGGFGNGAPFTRFQAPRREPAYSGR